MNKFKQALCIALALSLTVSAFAGCNKTDTQDASSNPSDTAVITPADPEIEVAPEEEEEVVDLPEETITETTPMGDTTDDQWEDSTEDIDLTGYFDLKVNNNKVVNDDFAGVNTVHLLYNYMPDKYGRTYNEKQVALELDTIEKMRIKIIRSFYGSSLSWDNKTKTHDFENEWMQAFYKNCKDMEKIGVEVGITPAWSIKSFWNELSGRGISIQSAGWAVPDDIDASCKNYEKFLEDSVLAFKAHGVNNVKYLFCFTECNNSFQVEDDGTEATDTALERRQYDKIYPVFDKAIRATDQALKNAGLRKQYKIVAPCDNWSTRDGSETYSRLTKYCVENLKDQVDIIGSHNGYARANEYTDDVYYQKFEEKQGYQVKEAADVGKPFWIDETNASINSAQTVLQHRQTNNNPFKGTALGAMVAGAMNVGVDSFFLWTLSDQVWPGMTTSSEQFDKGVHVHGYLPTLLESSTPLAAWYSLSLLTRYIGTGKVFESEVSQPAYIAAIERDDGEMTVVVINNYVLDSEITVHFEKSLKGKTFYRYLYNPVDVKPVPGNEMISADAVAKKVTTGFVDRLPGTSVAVYTTEKPE